MSRLEKTRERKRKNNKYRVLIRVFFILLMVVFTGLCVYEVDKSAREMLGEKEYKLPNISFNIMKEIKKFDFK